MAQHTSLKALAADKSVEGVKKTDIFRVDPRLLYEEEDFNLRSYDDPDVVAHIEGFARSYAAGAYVPPLIVHVIDGKVNVIEGHCRRRGALLAIERGNDIPFVDCISFRGSDSERVEVMLRSAEGLQLKPLEVSFGYLRLTRMGNSNSMIAQKVNKTVAHVEQMLLLATANSDVHQLVRAGAVSAATAIEAVRAHREKAGEFLKSKLNRGEKVSRSSIAGWTPPRKVVSSLWTSVEDVVKGLDKKTRTQIAEFEAMDPDAVKGKTIEVDAVAMLELVKAHQSGVSAKEAKESRESAKQAAKAQMEIADGEQD